MVRSKRMVGERSRRPPPESNPGRRSSRDSAKGADILSGRVREPSREAQGPRRAARIKQERGSAPAPETGTARNPKPCAVNCLPGRDGPATTREIERLVRERTAELVESNRLLRVEIDHHLESQKAASQREQALEALYAIATAFGISSDSMYDQIVLTLANLLHLPYAVFGRIERNELAFTATFLEGSLFREARQGLGADTCAIAAREHRICRVGDCVLSPAGIRSGDGLQLTSHLGVPIIGRTGDLMGVLCVMDHRERTYREDEMHLVEIFARYVRQEIEREEMESQLSQAREMRMLGQLTAGVAHEVRNPLNAILALSEALFQDLGDDLRLRPYLDHIRTQVGRLSALMRDLLDLGRPIRESELRSSSVESVVTSAATFWDEVKTDDRHTIRIATPPRVGSWLVRVDPPRIQQVFANLIENASDHSPEGGEIVLRVLEPEHGYVRIQVRDRGTGVTPGDLPRIFEPFFTTRKGGTGLGLNIVKHIIEVHGGEIAVFNNSPPPGSTAEIRLPVSVSGTSPPRGTRRIASCVIPAKAN